MHVELVDFMGKDTNVANAARVSFHKEVEVFGENDEKLLRYLAKHNHWSPFAHTSISLRVKAPIFIARQLAKHQVGGVWNEVSRRYVDEQPELYWPETWRQRSPSAKQGSLEAPCAWMYEEIYEGYTVEENLKEQIGYLIPIYNEMIDNGVCPEQARMILPQNMYTEWIWTGSVMFFARVIKQRLDPHAQKEVRDVAQMIKDVVVPLYPISFKYLLEEVNEQA